MPLRRRSRTALLILALAAFVLAGAIAGLGYLGRASRGKLLAEASRLLGREVRAGKIGVALWPSLGLRLASLVIAEDPGFGSTPFLTASGLVLRVSLLPLLRRHVVVERVVLEGPRLRIIRQAGGRLNVASLGRRAGARHRRNRTGTAKSKGKKQGSSFFHVAALDVRDGRVEYVDQERPGKPLVIERLWLHAASPSLVAPVKIAARAAIEAQELSVPVLELRGRVRPRAMRLRGWIAAERGTIARVRFKGLRGRVRLSPAAGRLERVRARALDGWVNGGLELKGGKLGLRVRAEDIDVAAVPAASSLEPDGRADLRLDLSGPEPSEPDFRQGLVGDVELVVRRGRLGALKVGPALLAALGLAFGRHEIAAARVTYPDVLGSGGMRFSVLDAVAHLGRGKLQVRRATVTAPSYGARAAGTVGLDGRVDLALTMRLGRALSQTLVRRRRERAVLLDTEGRVAVPVRVTGSLKRLAVYPDPSFAVRLGRRALEKHGLRRPARRLFQHLEELLRKPK